MKLVKSKLGLSSDEEVQETPSKKQKIGEDGGSKSKQKDGKKSSQKHSKDDDEEEDFQVGEGSEPGDSYDSDFD